MLSAHTFYYYPPHLYITMVLHTEHELPLVGREEETSLFSKQIQRTLEGCGGTLSVSGEAGIGKTRLVREFVRQAVDNGFKVVDGAADKHSFKPFQMLVNALQEESSEPILREEESTSFSEIFAVNDAGMLLATARPEDEDEIDGDIFAGMLSAIQNFVKDSFDRSGESKAGLGRLEYGDMKILIEHGKSIYVAAVIKGKEHPEMKHTLGRTVKQIEREYAEMLEDWSGDMEEMACVQDKISSLSMIKYSVRKDFEGVKLENERLRIADDVLELLKDMSRERPLMLLLEDLHWADESSLFVMDYISRNIGDHGVLTVCTRRPEEGEAAERTVKGLDEDGLITLMKLQKLTADDLKLLVDELYTPNDFPEDLIERLSKECQGNPFFVIEMLKQMEQEGHMGIIDGTYKMVTETFTIPSSVEEVVYRRLELLDPESIELVEYASCEGGVIDRRIPKWFDRVSDINYTMQNLMDSGILVQDADRYAFSHAIFRDVIYTSLSRWWKNNYHRSLGAFYETNYHDDLSEVYYELARHFSNTNQHEKAHDYSYKAGEKAESTLAAEQAIDFYQIAYDVLEHLHLPEGKKERRCDLLDRIGDMKGLLGDYKEAKGYYLHGLELSPPDTTKALLHRKLGNVFMVIGEYDRGIQECDTALALLESDDPEVMRVNRVKGRTYMRKGDYDDAKHLLEEGLSLAKDMGDDGEIAEIKHNMGTVEWYKGNYDDALTHLEEALEIRKEIQDHRGMARTSTNIGIVHYSKGELNKSIEYYRDALTSFEKIGDRLNTASAFGNIGMAFLKLGRLDESLEYFNHCKDTFEMVGDKGSAATALNNIALVYEKKGDIENALIFHKKAYSNREKIGDKMGMAMSLVNIGGAQGDYGDVDMAIDNLNKSIDMYINIGDKEGVLSPMNNLGSIFRKEGNIDKALEYHKEAADIAESVGSIDRACEIYFELVQDEIYTQDVEKAMVYAHRVFEHAEKTGSDKLLGYGHQALGMVHREMKKWDEAKEEFEAARSMLRAAGDSVDLSRLLYEYGVLWMTQGEKVEASRYLEEALEIQQKMGLKRDAEKTKGAISDLDEI